ncbi:hypothetical protein FHL15_000093 [Xylaria flabelliformis]|uniref:Uncharacterized protein n=1 Tax=Xylaria flabelliformis TaxID=2512241 RepID=A0A553IEV7_9PEZI|nr:hypothetical protein FHL15_000093 [Xylaria flabelliformis]
MAGEHGRSKSSKSKGKSVDHSAARQTKPQPRSPEDRTLGYDRQAATRNYIQSGTTTRCDGKPGPSTQEGDRELHREMARHIKAEESIDMKKMAHDTGQRNRQPKHHRGAQKSLPWVTAVASSYKQLFLTALHINDQSSTLFMVTGNEATVKGIGTMLWESA